MFLFKWMAKKSTTERARDWKRRIRREKYSIQREIRKLEKEEEKCKQNIKKSAKINDISSVRITAKALIRLKKTIKNLYIARTELNSTEMKITEQIAQYKVMKAFQQSTNVMRSMNNLVKIPQLNETMKKLSKEMQKAGLIQEIVDEEVEILEEDMDDDEIENVLNELSKDLVENVSEKGKFDKMVDNLTKRYENLMKDNPVVIVEENIKEIDESKDKMEDDLTKRYENLMKDNPVVAMY